MNLIRRLVTIGALLLIALPRLAAQVVERPVPFDSAGQVLVITPYIAERAALRAPWWPVSGEFTEARMYTVTDSSYILMVTRKTGVVERYTLSVPDRQAIRAIVTRLPREVVQTRNNERNAFVAIQTLLGVTVYGPGFAIAIADNSAAWIAGYFVVAGGSFFAASEISRRVFITRPQRDLSTNMGHNIALAGIAATYLFHGEERAQGAGAFVGGLAGTTLGLRLARHMTEADAIGAGFGSNIGALIGWGTAGALTGELHCTLEADGSFECGRRLSDRAQIAIILASGLIGYPLGVLYPRNARYNVTPGDIQTLYATATLGAVMGLTLVPENAAQSTAFAAATASGVLGIVAGDRFIVQRFDHKRSEGTIVTLGTLAGGLMGAGVAALIDTDFGNPRLVFGLATVGGLAGLMASEHYADAAKDAGRRGLQLSFNPQSILPIATRTPGNHSLLNVRF